ncbi:MAG: phosphatidylglycerol lysyltransferase domain-containing protein [bacterium]
MSKIPDYPKLKNLTFEDLQLLRNEAQICEFSPVNLLIWQSFDRPQLTLINNNICILISPRNEPPFFLEPIGDHKLLEAVEICLNHTGKISRATESFIEKVPLKKHKISCLRAQFDYVYETKTLAELKGKNFDGKRNHLKKFKKRHPAYTFVKLEPGHQEQARQLFEEWFSLRKESRHFPKLAYDSQKEAINRSFENFAALKLLGGALFVDGQIKGFTIGSWLNSETIAVHFLYGHPSPQGIFQTILWESCNKIYNQAKYVNLEQDLGIPGLRKSKLSYYPIKLEKKFEIKISS